MAAVETGGLPGAQGAFNDRITQLMREATVGTALAVASRSGLVVELCADATPATAGELGARANLEGKHVKELLGCLSSGGLVNSVDGVNEELFFVAEHQRLPLIEAGRLFQTLLLDRFDASTAFAMAETRSRRVTNMISSMECEIKSS
jgi:hypothetical protein